MQENKLTVHVYNPSNISYTTDELLEHAAEASQLVRSGDITKLQNFVYGSGHKIQK